MVSLETWMNALLLIVHDTGLSFYLCWSSLRIVVGYLHALNAVPTKADIIIKLSLD